MVSMTSLLSSTEAIRVWGLTQSMFAASRVAIAVNAGHCLTLIFATPG
jgi:hypothetical protein